MSVTTAQFVNSGKDPFHHMIDEYQITSRIMELVSPYFLSKYTNGSPFDVQQRQIDGVWHVVERFNHGLAHGLRQGALAKDLLNLLAQLPSQSLDPEVEGFLSWVRQKQADGLPFLAKLEMASSFQRTGRQKEFSSSDDPLLYQAYEWQDTLNFKKEAAVSGFFKNDLEIQLFQEAILWSNRGALDKETQLDLKYLRCILHAAHTMDLRRMPGFSEEKIKKDFLDQLFFGKSDCLPPALSKELTDRFWQRSGEYLQATGDRDLVSRAGLADAFFIQTSRPPLMVQAIHRIRTMTS